MKKAGSFILALVVALSLAGISGFYLVRNRRQEPITPRLISTAATSLPSRGTTPPPETTLPQPAFPVDLNTADMDTLMTLPGIGPVLAGRILEYRQTHGSFTQIDDLLEIDGIGQKRLEAIREYITIGGSS